MFETFLKRALFKTCEPSLACMRDKVPENSTRECTKIYNYAIDSPEKLKNRTDETQTPVETRFISEQKCLLTLAKIK